MIVEVIVVFVGAATVVLVVNTAVNAVRSKYYLSTDHRIATSLARELRVFRLLNTSHSEFLCHMCTCNQSRSSESG